MENEKANIAIYLCSSYFLNTWKQVKFRQEFLYPNIIHSMHENHL